MAFRNIQQCVPRRCSAATVLNGRFWPIEDVPFTVAPCSRNRAAVAHRVRARMARCSTRGPCAAVSRGRQAAQREPTWMSAPFRQGRMPCRKARPRLTDLPGRSPASAKRGGLSLWLAFSLATQRESNTASAGGRKLFALKARCDQRQSQQEHRD